ncbi:MAG TPA: pilin [Candidatus Paceibacterota bacterium]
MEDTISKLTDAIVNPLLKLMLAAAVLYFLWGVASFMMNREDESKANEGKQHMLYGVIGLAVILGAFGIVNVIADILKSLK